MKYVLHYICLPDGTFYQVWLDKTREHELKTTSTIEGNKNEKIEE